MKREQGFTLAEVLIAVALLGVVAAFSIPKVMQVISDNQQNAIAKETMAMISNAYQLYKKDNNGTVPITTMPEDLLPYMNTLGDYTGLEDDAPPAGNLSLNYAGGNPYVYNTTFPWDCSLTAVCRCIRLTNGAILTMNRPRAIFAFNGNSSQHAIAFAVDTDGKAGEPGSALGVALFYNGKLNTLGDLTTGTIMNGVIVGPGNAFGDPTWFQW